MQYFVASFQDQVQALQIQGPIALEAEILKIDVALQLMVYLQLAVAIDDSYVLT